MGRDVFAGVTLSFEQVSIHAPAWGATCSDAYANANQSFNSRARMGRDEPA